MPDIDSIRELLARGPAWIAEGQRLEAALAKAEAHHRSALERLGEVLAKREQAETALLAWYGTPGPTPAAAPGAAWPADVEAARCPVAIEAPLTELFPTPRKRGEETVEEKVASGHWDWCHWSGGIEGLAEAARSWTDGQLAEAFKRFRKNLVEEGRVILEEQERRKEQASATPRITLEDLCSLHTTPGGLGTWRGMPVDQLLDREPATILKKIGLGTLGLLADWLALGKGLAGATIKEEMAAAILAKVRTWWAGHTEEGGRGEFPEWLPGPTPVTLPPSVASLTEDGLTPDESLAQEEAKVEALAKKPRKKKDPPPPDPAFAADCPRCSAKAGAPCKNYKGQRKVACPERSQPVKPSAEEPVIPAKPGTTHYGHDASTFREEVKEWSDAQIAKELEHPRITPAEQLILLDEQMERRVKESKARVSKKKASEPPKAEPVSPGLDDLRGRYPGALLIYRGHEWCRIPAAEDLAAAEELGIPEGFKNSHLSEHVRTLLAAGQDVVVVDSKTGNEYPLFEWSVDGEFTVDVDGQKVNCLWRVKAQENHAAGALVLTGLAGVFAPRGYQRVLVKEEEQYGHPETQVRVCVADFKSTQREEVPA